MLWLGKLQTRCGSKEGQSTGYMKPLVQTIQPGQDWEISKFHNVIVAIATLGTKENPLWQKEITKFGNVFVTLTILGMLKKTHNGF